MFSNLQIRPARSHRRKPSLSIRAGVTKRRVSAVTAATASNVPSLSFMEELFGDEFPEAFATNPGGVRANKKKIWDLPVELLSLTCQYLSGLDIKRLRLASQHFAKHIDLRIDRVYISPNQANLDCLQWVIQHPRHSKRVREIVWDDAQLEEYPTLESFRQAIVLDQFQWTTEIERRLEKSVQGHSGNGLLDYDFLDRDVFFPLDGRLNDAAKDILLQYEDRFSRAVLARSAFMMSVEDSYVLYTKLYEQERDLIKRRIDVSALEHALQHLPGLRKITLTSEVWRPWNYVPRYDTPYSRSLPAGFRKPTVWPWLEKRPLETEAMFERRFDTLLSPFTGWLPTAWRGYTIVTSALLSQQSNNIEEFIIDTGRERTGLNRNLFTQPNQELDQTMDLFRRIPLKRLQLVINDVRCDDILRELPHTPPIWDQLKRALNELQYLTHFDLQLHGDLAQCFYWERVLPPFLPSQLKTLSLRAMVIAEPSLLRLVKRMRNAQQITLDNITLVPDQEHSNWVEASHPEHFFYTLRDYYAEFAQETSIARPFFTWIENLGPWQSFFHRCRMVHEEINDFLYGGWDCPFDGRVVKENVGWVIDTRDSEFKQRMAEYTPQDDNDDDDDMI